MQAIRHLFCAIGLHRPELASVAWNGRQHVAHCNSCHTTIIRRAPKVWTGFL